MASQVIITDLFRASHVHLKEKKAFQQGDTPKFRVAAMWPKTGIGQIAKIGVQFNSSPNNLFAALKQIVMEEFGFDYDPLNPEQTKMFGIQFPPNFKDGDKQYKKENGVPVQPFQVDPIQAGHWILNLSTEDPVGVSVPVNGGAEKDRIVDPSVVYSGCWGQAQLELSAYTNKQGARIINIELLNFRMCYDDESFGGAAPRQSAENAFAGHSVANSNLSANIGNTSFAQVPAAAPIAPVAAVTMVPGCQYTYDQLKQAGFTDDQMVAQGYATKAIPQPVAPAPIPQPVAIPQPVVLAPIPQPVAPAPIPQPVVPAPIPQPVMSVPVTGKVIMKPDSQYTYEQLLGFGFNDDQMIAQGYAVPNFTNPQ